MSGGRPLACPVARHRPLSPFRAGRARCNRIKASQLRERAAGYVADYSGVDPVEQRRAIAVEAAERGWFPWELEKLIGPLSEIEAAWFERNRRVTA